MRRAVNLARKRAMARGELNAVLVFGFVAALCLFVALARVTGPVSMLSKRAHEQQLWNAASNDVITKYNVGKPHAYDFVHSSYHRAKALQLQRLNMESATGKHHVITDPRENQNQYEPMKWLHQQGEPSAVQTRKSLHAALRARTQMLWNAAANDEGGGLNPDINKEITKWNNQADATPAGGDY